MFIRCFPAFIINQFWDKVDDRNSREARRSVKNITGKPVLSYAESVMLEITLKWYGDCGAPNTWDKNAETCKRIVAHSTKDE